ncbi:hypothetical protein J1614_002848 [Plenodomus biglobosus]|nr:hypothetical protein J1614_002848 [Plenodomus biglobosus]
MTPAPHPHPALFPPADGAHHTWPAPNFVNPETRNWAAPASIIALFIVTFGIFSARIWARFGITKTSGLDDWLIVAAMPTLLGLTIATVLALREYGFHLHIYDQTPRTNITVRQITLAMETIYLASTTLTKISILLFYRRITSSIINRNLLIAVWASIIFVAIYGISSICAIIFTCSPIEAYWFRFTTWWLRTHKYKCYDEILVLIVIIVISAVQDLIACVIPMFVVVKLRLPLRQKMALSAIFLIGLATCGIGALRIHYAHRVYYYTKLNPSPTYDITWEALGSWVSTAVEANLAIICGCAPALKTYFPQWLNSSGPQTRSFGWYGRRRRPGGRDLLSILRSSGTESSRSVLTSVEMTIHDRPTPRTLQMVDTLRIEVCSRSSKSQGNRTESSSEQHVHSLHNV